MPILLALGRCRSLERAAEHLNVNRTTISRRLKTFEQKLGARLFTRREGVYQLTAIGRELFVAAETAEGSLATAEKLLLDDGASLSGPMRITVPPHIMPLIAGLFTSLARKRPAFEIDVIATYELEEIEAREADIALRILRQPPEHPLVGKMLKGLRGAVYENKTCDRGDAVYVLRHGEIKTSLDTAAQHGAGAIIHVDDIWAKQELIASGGIGRLPVFMGDGDARLKRASDVLPDLGWKLWMVTHEAFKTSPRLKVIMSEISAYFDALDDTRDGAAH